MKTCKLPVTGLRVCSMCNLNVVEDEYHFILQCHRYVKNILMEEEDILRNIIGKCRHVLN